MNPPSALHGAMSRDRKPFTYTPGGIDLSEIKSQRMAQRLMRNAMNPGVPEVPVHPVLPSMPSPTAAKALPSFSCLPVQVFPAMPANPKQLLRTRSNPDPRNGPNRMIPPTSVNNARFENNDTSFKNNTLPFSQQINNNRPTSMYDYSKADKSYNSPGLNYGSDGYTAPVALNLPTNKPAYGYAPVAPPVFAPVSAPLYTPVPAPIPVSAPVLPENSDEPEFFRIPNYDRDDKSNEQLSELKTFEEKDIVPANDSVEASLDWTVNLTEDVTVRPIQEETVVTAPPVTDIVEDIAEIDDEQREVKVVKKQVTKESKVEKQNGNQNGDANEEAEMTVKLPTKKSGAKTETKVEVERRTLPDGSTEEVKTTTTKTTIDGRTEIKTRTETTIIPKEDESEEEFVEEEEEEEAVAEETGEQKETEEPETVTVTQTISAPKENGSVVKTEERSETTITKKVAIVQELPQPEESGEAEEEVIEEDEVEEAEPVTVILKKPVTPEPETESKPVEEEVEEEEEEEIEEDSKPTKQEEEEKVEVEQVEVEQKVEEEIQEEVEEKVEVKATPTKQDEEEQEEEEEEYEEAEEEKQEVKVKEEKTEDKETVVEQEEEPVEKTVEEVKEEVAPGEVEEQKVEVQNIGEQRVEEQKEELKAEEHIVPIQVSEESKSEIKEEKPAEFTIPIREPSVPLEKVEDVEIKPIGMSPIITKTHTENTEIRTSTIDPSGGLSKQTEYNKIENIVTVNRTTKILDHSYENITQQSVPTVKTYFPPPSIDRISTSPMPSRPYQPVYPPEPTTERRHSLLLERLSMERQMPSDIINQYNSQTYEQTQYQGEPQSEVLTVSNVKPSSITNQQWYQQNKQTQSIYNNVVSNSAPVGAPWAQPKSPQPQQQYQPQPQYQPPAQPQYQAPLQRGTTPQPQFQRGTTPQPAYQKPITPQPQYQPTYSEPIRDRTPTNNYSPYTPTPTWVASAVETPSTTYSYLNKDTTQNYQKNTLNSTTQQYSSGYVPPPWEQDSNYTSVNNTSEKFYQEVPQTNTFSPAPTQGWKPTPPPAKFTKPAPIAYVPPAPNQSFVKPVIEVPRQPGRKTYYSEYERRYISVPESTYIPTETKFQPQPDPSPQYYYDNNEPSETVEPQWRRELREFTEKTSQTITTEQTNIQPPWEADPKYAKEPAVPYTPTPTWTTQTLRPQSYNERTFESELSQEWPKTSTLGRRRPLSTLGVGNDGKVTERVRGVSVDRYNPNSYQPPAEHPPVQTHTLTTPTPHASYHNPNVPAYHARASAEPREQPINYQRVYREARASPLQSRSFKYLQWITGTEN